MKDYSSKNIKIIKGLEAVRKVPMMYTKVDSPLHTISEVIDNSVDEHIASACGKPISVTIDGDTITVSDSGRGLPIDIHHEEGKTGARVVLETLHAGGKFGGADSSYTTTGGLHGVGVSVALALSKSLVCEVKRDGSLYKVVYANGENVVEEVTSEYLGKDTGTSISVVLEDSFYQSPLNPNDLKEYLVKISATSGLKILYTVNGVAETIQYDLFKLYASKAKVTKSNGKFIHFSFPFVTVGNPDQVVVEGAVFVGYSGYPINMSFYNNVETPRGGSHEYSVIDGAKEGIHEVVSDKIRVADLVYSDYKIGCIVSIKIPKSVDAQLGGQTKESLSCVAIVPTISSRIKEIVSAEIHDDRDFKKKLTSFFLTKIKRRKEKNKEDDKKTNKADRPAKLKDCTKKGAGTELFFVEGDSAINTSEVNRRFQAYLTMKGYATNEVALKKLTDGPQDPIVKWITEVAPNLYEKFMLFTDADPAGKGIAANLAAQIYYFAPWLVEEGRLWVVKSPLYCVRDGKGGDTFFYSKEDFENSTIDKSNVVRYKGLGEIPPRIKKKLCINPTTRENVVQIVADTDHIYLEKVINSLYMKKNAEERRLWYSTGRFSWED